MQIDVNHVSLCYGCGDKSIQVLQDVDLHIRQGEFVGIMGRTGCGKTSLVQLIAGLIAPTSGQILIDGQNIHASRYDRTRLREKLGYVFQYAEYQLFESTVYRDVAFALKHSRLSREEKQQHVKTALEDMGFDYEAIRDLSPLSLSGGEKRRVAIAGVLAAQPQILILDEPVAGLDPKARDTFVSLLKKLNTQGVTILMISHNADILGACAERLIILDEGKLAFDAPTQEVFSHRRALADIHLDVSFASRMRDRLAARGMELAPCITYDQLLSGLKYRMGGRQ